MYTPFRKLATSGIHFYNRLKERKPLQSFPQKGYSYSMGVYDKYIRDNGSSLNLQDLE
jgi:hypothetical protein